MIKAVIGLGNPGRQFYFTRHNIGFRVLDALAEQHGARWTTTDLFESTTIQVDNRAILLIKPQTFMNASGKVVPYLQKKGIHAPEILVIHDELELPFGKIAFKQDGSAKGHNGLKSLIAAGGAEFARIRCGIGRPEAREDVPDYVLSLFSQDQASVEAFIQSAVDATIDALRKE